MSQAATESARAAQCEVERQRSEMEMQRASRLEVEELMGQRASALIEVYIHSDSTYIIHVLTHNSLD